MPKKFRILAGSLLLAGCLARLALFAVNPPLNAYDDHFAPVEEPAAIEVFRGKERRSLEVPVGLQPDEMEIAEIAMKAQGEAVSVISKAMMANIDDLKVATKSA